MPTKILYVPFNRDAFRPKNFGVHRKLAGEEYTGEYGKNQAWRNVIEKRKKMVTEDGSEPVKIVDMIEVVADGHPHPAIVGLKKEDQVYVRGHCLTGLESVFSHDDSVEINSKHLRDVFKGHLEPFALVPRVEVLPANIVANRLIQSGLKPEFQGAIKCFNCHSGEPRNGNNFSRAFVTQLHKRGYKNCTVYGYVGALDSYPGAQEWSGHEHGGDPRKMHTIATRDDVDDYGMKTTDVLGRASKNRYEALPYT